MLFPFLIFGGEIDLFQFERQVYSQHGEDGVIEAFFSLVPPASKFCVEFGAGDGINISNTCNLRLNHKWTTLLLEGSYENKAINLHREFITAENINTLFAKYRVPENLDLLSIDIDGNDFYVWFSLDERYKPALVVIEYNAGHQLTEDKVIEYDPKFVCDWTNYFGASLKALYNLARKKGYSLIYVDRTGTNAFFARDELINKLSLEGIHFKNLNDILALGFYSYPYFPQDPKYRRFTSSEEIFRNFKKAG